MPRVTLAAKLLGLDCVPEGKLWGAPGSKQGGLALEGPGLKTGPGGLKVSILTSDGRAREMRRREQRSLDAKLAAGLLRIMHYDSDS